VVELVVGLDVAGQAQAAVQAHWVGVDVAAEGEVEVEVAQEERVLVLGRGE
jgi:hypothetical protein